ncbi:MAG: hypothetical protein KDD19_01990 [Phaeodactylibacter sp.]|nr:hypothetical protein [Phaeodactylibacter sp.]
MKTFLVLLLCLLASASYGQQPFSSNERTPVTTNVLQLFDGARCLQRGEATVQLEAYGFHQFRQLAPFFEPMATYPFCIYFREREEGPLYLLFKGFCRGMHVTVPVVYRGWYYVVVFDQQQPSLLEIDARQLEVKIDYAAACVLHETQKF